MPITGRPGFPVPVETAGGGNWSMLVAGRLWVAGFGSPALGQRSGMRSEEHTSELQSLMRISYAVFCLKKQTKQHNSTIYKYKHKQNNNRQTRNDIRTI